MLRKRSNIDLISFLSLDKNEPKTSWVLVGEAIAKMADNRRTKGSERSGKIKLGNFSRRIHYFLRAHDEEKKKTEMHNELVAHFKMRRLSIGQVSGNTVPNHYRQVRQRTSALGQYRMKQKPVSSFRFKGTIQAFFAKQSCDNRTWNRGQALSKLNDKVAIRKSSDSFHKTNIWGPWFPDTLHKKLWDFTIILIVIFQTLHIPWVACFRPPMNFTWWCIDLIFDSIFLIDVAINFNMAYRDRMDYWITDRRIIIKSYLKGWFLVDFLASVPLDIIVQGAMGGSQPIKNDTAILGLLKAMRLPKLLRLLKILRVLRFSKFLRNRPGIIWMLQYSKHSNLLRVFRMLIMICVVLHYHACIFYFITSREEWMGMENCDWAWDSGIARTTPCQTSTYLSRYIAAYYNAVLLLQGEDVAPQTFGEKIYCACSILSGSILVAIIFGNVSMLISSLSSSSSAYHSKMEKIFKTMNHLELPPPLRRRVTTYYEAIWKRYRSLDGHIRMFVPELNSSLQTEVYVYIRTNLILGVPFLRNCSPDVVKELVMRMTEEVHLKGDYIVHKGSYANEMFCISRGCCEVTNHEVALGGTKEVQAETNSLLKMHSRGAGTNAESTTPLRAGILPPLTALKCSDSEVECAMITGPPGVGNMKNPTLIPPVGSPSLPEPNICMHESKHRPQEKVLKVLVEGESFGEIALIMECKRNCNVRSASFVELCLLSRSDFYDVLSQESYAEDKALMEGIIMEKNKHDHAAFDLHRNDIKRKSELQKKRGNLTSLDIADLKYQLGLVEVLVQKLKSHENTA